MPVNFKFADIILPFPLSQTFTYGIPDEFLGLTMPGMRVVVQFGAKRLYTGIVQSIHNNQPTEYTVKPIVSVLDSQPVVNDLQLQHWQWISNYYMSPIGDVMKAALLRHLFLGNA